MNEQERTAVEVNGQRMWYYTEEDRNRRSFDQAMRTEHYRMFPPESTTEIDGSTVHRFRTNGISLHPESADDRPTTTVQLSPGAASIEDSTFISTTHVIPTGGGLMEQINNTSPISSLTYESLERYITDAFFQTQSSFRRTRRQWNTERLHYYNDAYGFSFGTGEPGQDGQEQPKPSKPFNFLKQLKLV